MGGPLASDFSARAVLVRSVKVWSRNLFPILLFGILALMPFGIASSGLARHLATEPVVASLLYLAVIVSTSGVVAASITHIVVHDMRGRPLARLNDALQPGFLRMIDVIGTVVVTGVVIGAG